MFEEDAEFGGSLLTGWRAMTTSTIWRIYKFIFTLAK
jgi:hypothetical protein